MLKSESWDRFFLGLAKYMSERSKDPSTKVGAVIVDEYKIVRGLGYNGYPRGMIDDEKSLNNREEKHKYVVHAELNSILNSNGPVRGCAMYIWPLISCNECAKAIIQSGIKQVVYPLGASETWHDKANNMFEEVGVEVIYI